MLVAWFSASRVAASSRYEPALHPSIFARARFADCPAQHSQLPISGSTMVDAIVAADSGWGPCTNGDMRGLRRSSGLIPMGDAAKW
jgi:hypothetical protein